MPARKLLVPMSGKLVLLSFDEIEWVEARGNYCLVHANGSAHRMRATLKELLARMPSSQFLRVHRSALVNLGAIREIENAGNRRRLVLASGERIRVSREQWKQLKVALSHHIAA